MEDCLICKISSVIKYPRNQNYNTTSFNFSWVIYKITVMLYLLSLLLRATGAPYILEGSYFLSPDPATPLGPTPLFRAAKNDTRPKVNSKTFTPTK